MLRHGKSFIALTSTEFDEAATTARSEHTSVSRVVLTGTKHALADALPLEYEGHAASVRPDSSVDFVDAAVAAVIQLAGTLSDGPELLRHIQRPGYAQFLTYSDQSLELADKFTSLQRIGRTSDGKSNARPRSFVTKNANSVIPEVAWLAKEGSDLQVAQGLGTTKDACTGATLYHGMWAAGVRHGVGKGAIYERQSTTGDDPAVYIGAYEGHWALGLRHGRGFLLESGGDRYEGEWAFDLRHGEGLETIAGGGSFRGSWCRGVKHGLGLFTWPQGLRPEWRQYDRGALVSSRTLDAPLPLGIPVGDATATPGIAGIPRAATWQGSLAAAHDQSLLLQEGGAAAATSGGSAVTGAGSGAAADGEVDVPMLQYTAHTADGGSHLVSIPVHITGGVGSSLQQQGRPRQASQPRPNDSILRLLRHMTVTDLLGGLAASGSVITVNLDDAVELCITRMTDHNVLSVPVFDKASDRFVAVVHILDIFAFMLDLVAKKKATFSPAGLGLRESLAHQRRFAAAPISEVLAMSTHISSTEFKPLPEAAPLLYAVQLLAEGSHAVPVLSASGNILRMVTQADVVRFIGAHLDELGALGPMTVGELGLGTKATAGHLIIARFSDNAFDVLQAMRVEGAPAAPVVDNYGAMAANLSLSDVKAIARKGNFSALQLPLQQFFAAIDKGITAMSPSIYVRASTQLQSLVLTLSATKIHQLYFVDDSLRPVGTVRIVDILKLLLRED